jgi:hypothetical protein
MNRRAVTDTAVAAATLATVFVAVRFLLAALFATWDCNTADEKCPMDWGAGYADFKEWTGLG